MPRVSGLGSGEEPGADSSADRGADVGRMLAADKLLLRSTVKQKAIELREKELNLFNSNFSAVATQACAASAHRHGSAQPSDATLVRLLAG